MLQTLSWCVTVVQGHRNVYQLKAYMQLPTGCFKKK